MIKFYLEILALVFKLDSLSFYFFPFKFNLVETFIFILKF